jgi:hypothetical protein
MGRGSRQLNDAEMLRVKADALVRIAQEGDYAAIDEQLRGPYACFGRGRSGFRGRSGSG